MANQVDYRDPTPNNFPKDYDPTKVDSRVKLRSDSIKHKQKGVDTREAMYQALEIGSVTANEAKETAIDTASRQDAFEGRYNEQIAGNTSLNEVIDARNGKSNLKTRLDDEHAQVTEQLAQMVIVPDVVDGEDNYDELTTFFNDSPEGSSILFPQGQEIKVSKPLLIKKSNLSIDFNGSKLVYIGNSDLGVENGRDRIYGALTIKGDLLPETQVSITEIKNLEGVIDEKYYVNGNHFKGLQHPLTQVSKITTNVSNLTNNYKTGDYVVLRAKNYGTTWALDYSDNPTTIDVIAKVVYIEADTIYVDVSSDFEFKTENLIGTLTKISPLRNITIENLNFEDGNETPVPTLTDVPFSDRQSWVGGINAQYTVNLQVNNYNAEKFRFPALMTRYAYNPSIKKVTASFPRTVTAGCGYGMQIINSSHGIIEHVRGYSARHLVDFSGGGHMWVKDVKMPNDWHGALDCHGNGEFDITFENCTGNFIIGNGIKEFPEMTGNVSLFNCTGSLQLNWAKKVKVKDSTLYMDAQRISRTPSFEVHDSDLIFKRTQQNFVSVTRGQYRGTSFILDNVSLEIKNERNPFVSLRTKLFEVDNFEYVSINLRSVKNHTNTHMIIYLTNCKYVNLLKSKVINIGFVFNEEPEISDNTYLDNALDLTKRVIRVNDNDFDESLSFDDVQPFLEVLNNKNQGVIALYVVGNTFDSLSKTRWLRTLTDVATLYITADNNHLRGKVGGPGSNMGLKPPFFVSRKGNIDMASSTDPSLIEGHDFNKTILAPVGIKEYTITFPEGKTNVGWVYSVVVTPGWNAGNWWTESKTDTGFVVKFNAPPTYASDFTVTVIDQ